MLVLIRAQVEAPWAAKLAGIFRGTGFFVGIPQLRNQCLPDLRDRLAQQDNLLAVSRDGMFGIESLLREFGETANCTERVVGISRAPLPDSSQFQSVPALFGGCNASDQGANGQQRWTVTITILERSPRTDGWPTQARFWLEWDCRRCLFYDCAGSSRGTSSKICMISCILCFALP